MLPDVVVEGVQLPHVRLPDVRYLLFGDEQRINPLLERFPDIKPFVEVRHTDKVIGGNDKPEPGAAHRAHLLDVAGDPGGLEG